MGDGKPVVLFLCVHNAGRGQMAMGFFGDLAGDAAVAWSVRAVRHRRPAPVSGRRPPPAG